MWAEGMGMRCIERRKKKKEKGNKFVIYVFLAWRVFALMPSDPTPQTKASGSSRWTGITGTPSKTTILDVHGALHRHQWSVWQ
jgi:hypothetical protein